MLGVVRVVLGFDRAVLGVVMKLLGSIGGVLQVYLVVVCVVL